MVAVGLAASAAALQAAFISNGDFESGSAGFTSHYRYVAPADYGSHPGGMLPEGYLRSIPIQ